MKSIRARRVRMNRAPRSFAAAIDSSNRLITSQATPDDLVKVIKINNPNTRPDTRIFTDEPFGR